MASANLKAGAGALAHAATMTGRAHDDFEAMARQLSGRLESSLVGWQGAGSAAFQRLHLSWQEHHRCIAALLQELESVFRQTDTSFDDTDLGARHRLEGVASDLHARLG